VAIFTKKLQELFGCSEIHPEKVLNTLWKNDFDTRKSFTLVKKKIEDFTKNISLLKMLLVIKETLFKPVLLFKHNV